MTVVWVWMSPTCGLERCRVQCDQNFEYFAVVFQNVDTLLYITTTSVAEPDHPLFDPWDRPRILQVIRQFGICYLFICLLLSANTQQNAMEEGGTSSLLLSAKTQQNASAVCL